MSAWEGGMAVFSSSGTATEIPLVAEPEVFSRAALAALASEARAILSGAVKLARALLAQGNECDSRMLSAPFEGLEAEAMSRLFEDAPCPAIVARIDFLSEGANFAPRALELNATIPAMPAYGDLAAQAWIRAAARARGMAPRQADDLIVACGSNMENLRRALAAFYRSRGGTKERPSIALVARPGDAQQGELRRLAEHFRQLGHRAATLTPDECEPEGWDVLYRHIWAHNTPPESPFAAALRAPHRFVLANPVNGVLEVKGLFARLSECGEDLHLARLAGLDDAELAAARRLPLTRLLDEALAPRVVAERERWVLKRNWGYGGKGVRIGSEIAPAAWAGEVNAALADRAGGGFVAQERVISVPRSGTRVSRGGIERLPLCHDVSTYTGLGPFVPSGSVVRASSSPVVNLLGGGGLVPVLPEDVAAALA
ncbi:MAG TPA: hypothetical protein VMK12_27500 [Anaeromyxobacteraceae bacterium]|nr:hypothetical protein [Anaeromyxobacteraceae bacterium]